MMYMKTSILILCCSGIANLAYRDTSENTILKYLREIGSSIRYRLGVAHFSMLVFCYFLEVLKLNIILFVIKDV